METPPLAGGKCPTCGGTNFCPVCKWCIPCGTCACWQGPGKPRNDFDEAVDRLVQGRRWPR